MIRIAGLGNTDLSEKEDISNRGRCDGVDLYIIRQVVETTVHGRSGSKPSGPIKPETKETRNDFPCLHKVRY